MIFTQADQRHEIFEELKKYREFYPFQRAFGQVENITIHNDLYSGVWCEYSADLVEGVVWDLELVEVGLSKLNISKETDVLVDLCCGEGRLARHLANKSYRLKGIDYSADQINRARLLDSDNIVGEDSWVVSDLLDKQSVKSFSSMWDSVIAVTSAASVNCFTSHDQLSSFLYNIRTCLGKNGPRFLLLPVFDDEAVSNFEKTFKGNILCHPFKSQTNKDMLAWISLLYDKESKLLIQPSITALTDSEGELKYEFVFSKDRIWTTTEVAGIAADVGWTKEFILPSNVVSGGADQWPFALLVLKNEF